MEFKSKIGQHPNATKLARAPIPSIDIEEPLVDTVFGTEKISEHIYTVIRVDNLKKVQPHEKVEGNVFHDLSCNMLFGYHDNSFKAYGK